MKFDLEITNPPYCDSSHSEKKNTLWRKFVKTSHDRVKDGGIIAHIVPSSWMGSERILKESFLHYNILYINKDECRRHFAGVGSTFSYFIMQRSQHEDKTIIVNKEISGKIITNTVNINDIIFGAFPRNMSQTSVNILKKVLSSDRPKLGIVNNTTHHSVHRDRWKTEQVDEFQYPIQNTPSKLYYWNSPHKDQGKIKVIIPTTTYYRKMMLTTHGVTQSFCYYNVREGENSEIVLHNLNNILFDYVNECFRYANWNSVSLLRKLPRIPFNKMMNDEEVCRHFNLTEDEIKLLKESITWR